MSEPFVTELQYAMHFFKGVALSGTSQPENALEAFEEAAKGIRLKDDTLNNVISNIAKEKEREIHNLGQYYAMVSFSQIYFSVS